MPLLLFKKPFRVAILAGRKTTTLRRWHKRRMKGGDRVRVMGVGWILLDSVEPVSWESLTSADAKADGFDSLDELSRAVRKIYPRMEEDGKSWFRIRFMLDPNDPMRLLAAGVRRELDKAVRNNGS